MSRKREDCPHFAAGLSKELGIKSRLEHSVCPQTLRDAWFQDRYQSRKACFLPKGPGVTQEETGQKEQFMLSAENGHCPQLAK